MLTHLWRSLIAFRKRTRPVGIKIDGRPCANLQHALQLAAYQDQLDAARLHRAMADASKRDQEALLAMIATLKAMLETRKASA